MLSTKTCSRCKQTLSIDSFCKHKGRKDGHGDWCKRCASAYIVNRYHQEPSFRTHMLRVMKQYHKNMPDEQRLRIKRKAQKKYRQKNKAKIKASDDITRLLTRTGMRKRLLERAKGKCELCHTTLIFTEKHHNYSIHHKDGNRYNNDLDNLIVVCTKCHLHKLHPRPRKVYAI